MQDVEEQDGVKTWDTMIVNAHVMEKIMEINQNHIAGAVFGMFITMIAMGAVFAGCGAWEI